jgi:hypothetical protein
MRGASMQRSSPLVEAVDVRIAAAEG